MDTTNQDRRDNMKSMTCKLSLAIIVCTTMCLSCTYTYTDVLPPGWRNTKATSINDNGDVVGYGCEEFGCASLGSMANMKGFV